MPRHARSWVPGWGAHLISRFVDRRFHLVDDHDRQLFLRSIGRASDRWDWRWLSWALMSSHVHQCLLAGEDAPDRFLRSAHTRFAAAYHGSRTHETLGPVFAERPKLFPVPQSELLRVVAYHHRNPGEAGVVAAPRDSTWTSHRVYLRLDPAPPWFDVEWALDLLGFRDTAAGRREFDEFVIEADLADRPWARGARSEAMVLDEGCDVEWSTLCGVARELAGMPAGERLGSKRRSATLTRRLIATVATRDLGRSYASVGRELGMCAGSVYNLVERPAGDLDRVLAELRKRLNIRARRE